MRHANRSVNVHDFAMVPRSDVQRSIFNIQKKHMTTFDAGYLIPIHVDELLPGDSFNLSMNVLARMSTPINPVMDNLHLDSFFFFVPMRLIWTNWEKMMGEQNNPGDSISYIMPTTTSPAGGYAANSLYDYMGLPTVGQLAGGATYTHTSAPMRAYNKIWNDWFRDENLQNSVPDNMGDGPDNNADYVLKRRGKRHDYFTSALPWPQKGNPVSIPLIGQAPVKWDTYSGATTADNQFTVIGKDGAGVVGLSYGATYGVGTGALPNTTQSNLYADLGLNTATTINALRQASTMQQFLEKDARGGTRYTEVVRSHFGVQSPDARLQRPEFLGHGSSPVNVHAVPQTGPTGTTGATTPQGNLAAFGTVSGGRHGFNYSATEHGYIIGLISVRADLTYQQGVRKMMNRSTRYDFFWPMFANLGEQAILNKEIYARGDANDDLVFGYQERYGEYRYQPSMITGLFKSTTTGTIDNWHLAQRFTSLPTLNDTFIQDTPPMSRVLAVGAAADSKQFFGDFFFNIRAARPMPMYGVPGLTRF